MNTHQQDFRQFREELVRGDSVVAAWAPRILNAVTVLVFFAALCATTPVQAELDADHEVECLALNIYHEARGEPDEGKVAVGHVVMNRAADPRFSGSCL